MKFENFELWIRRFLVKTYSKPIQKFWNFAITFVLHQYLTTKNIINSKNAQSHLAFDQTPSICTIHICKKIQKFQKIGRRLAAAPLLLLSSPSALQCVGAGGDHGAGAERKGRTRSGPWERRRSGAAANFSEISDFFYRYEQCIERVFDQMLDGFGHF